MKIPKKVSQGVPFARKDDYEYEGHKYDADLKQGDKVTILNEGMLTPGTYGEQYIFKIETRNGEKALALNQTTLNILHDELGEDSKEWIGQKVNVLLKKDVVAGKKVIIAYLVTDGWYFDEYRELVKEGSEKFNSDEHVVDIDDL